MLRAVTRPSAKSIDLLAFRTDADSTIRFSLGYATTDAEIEHAAQAVERAVRQVRTALAEAVDTR